MIEQQLQQMRRRAVEISRQDLRSVEAFCRIQQLAIVKTALGRISKRNQELADSTWDAIVEVINGDSGDDRGAAGRGGGSGPVAGGGASEAGPAPGGGGAGE